MSTITKDTIRDLAHLARLAMTEAELGSFTADIARIMDWIDVLQDAALEDVLPMESLHATTLAMGEDAPAPTPGTEAMTKHAAQSDKGMFRVPRAVS